MPSALRSIYVNRPAAEVYLPIAPLTSVGKYLELASPRPRSYPRSMRRASTDKWAKLLFLFKPILATTSLGIFRPLADLWLAGN
jgi:hypothetical protein